MAGLLDGKVAFVTGGGSGIGRAAALALAEEGARVLVTDRAADTAEATAAAIRSAGGKADAEALDVTDEAAVDSCVDRLVERFSRLDCAFNNAGVSLEGASSAWGGLAPFDGSMDINARGVFLCMRAELRHMEGQGAGAIVNTASVAGLSGLGGAGYCASKHAVIGLTRSAAMSYATRGIRVNAVCPGAIVTPMVEEARRDPKSAAMIDQMHPMGRSGEPREVADAVIFLLSDKASFITGHPLAVDGGFLAR